MNLVMRAPKYPIKIPIRVPPPATVMKLTIIEKGLPEDCNVQNLIHLDLIEDGKHSDGVNCSDERAKEESLQETELLRFGFKEGPCLTDTPECNTNGEHVEDGANNSHE